MKKDTSIITDINHMLGIPEGDQYFDTDVITHLNTAIMTLRQNGIGPETLLTVEDAEQVWADFEEDSIPAIKSYLYYSVKLMFDPPANTTVMESIKSTMDELLWRIRLEKELGDD